VRIEDVSVDDDPDDLRRIADLLAGEKIPFQFSLIPIFRNPAQSLEVRLSDRRSFTDALHYMIAHGGTPVMHGVTHQYHGQSGDDFEFWDDAGDRPIVGDSTDFVLRRLDLGLSECFASGIYPIAFETPHYAASEVDYRAFRRVFRLFSIGPWRRVLRLRVSSSRIPWWTATEGTSFRGPGLFAG